MLNPILSNDPTLVPTSSSPAEHGNNTVINAIAQLASNRLFGGMYTPERYYSTIIAQLAHHRASTNDALSAAQAALRQVNQERVT